MKKDSIKKDDIKRDGIKKDSIKKDSIKKDNIKKDNIKKDNIKKDRIKKDHINKDNIKKCSIKKDSMKKDLIKKDKIKKDKIKKEPIKVFIMQPEDYGKRVNENLTRLGIYRNKIRNIFGILQKKKVVIRVFDGNTIIEEREVNRYHAFGMVTEYGEKYFLEVFYTNSRDAIHIRLKGKAPKKAA